MRTSKRAAMKQSEQAILPFSRRGGRRRGAGRKPKGDEAGVSHRSRAPLKAHFPVHVTLKLSRGLPRLRQRAEYEALRAAFAAGCTGGKAAPGAFRLCQYAILNNHITSSWRRTTATR